MVRKYESPTWLLLLALLVALSTALWMLSPTQASAQEPPAAEESADKAPAASAPQGGTAYDASEAGESVSGLNLMVIAYIAIWLGLFFYFLTLLGRQRKLRSDLEELRARIHALDERVQEQQ